MFEPNLLASYKILVTSQCNMNCAYCFQRDKRNQCAAIDPFDAINIGKQLINVNSQEINIHFTGGEPLLEFDRIKEIVIALARYNKLTYKRRLQFRLVTNGTLVTNEILSFLKEYNFKVSVSLDGLKACYACHRGDEKLYDLALNNAIRLKETLGFVSANVVVTNQTVDMLYDNVMFITKNLGIKHMNVSPVVCFDEFRPDLIKMENAYDRILEYAIANPDISIVPITDNYCFKKKEPGYRDNYDVEITADEVNIIKFTMEASDYRNAVKFPLRAAGNGLDFYKLSAFERQLHKRYLDGVK